MKRFISSMLLVLSSLLIALNGTAFAQSAACIKHCSQWDVGCKEREFNCENKLRDYKVYMQWVRSDATTFSLPQLYIDLLRDQYPRVDLSSIRLAYSPRQATGAITDCNTIFFASQSYANKVRDGALSKDAGDNFRLLYHELRHTEQCIEKGGRDFYAVMWWNDIDTALTSTHSIDPVVLHDAQPMEADADAREASVDNLFPDGLVLPVSISGLTSNLTSPHPLNNPINWTAQASGGRGAIDFTFEVRMSGRSSPVDSRVANRDNSYTFRPTQEGSYTIRVAARQASPPRQFVRREESFVVSGTGAGGGNQFSSGCPAGFVMMGLDVRTGRYVDSLRAVCVKVRSDGSWMMRDRVLVGQEIYQISKGNTAGGTGGAPASLRCPSGTGVYGLFGRSWNGIDSIGILCGNLGRVGSSVVVVGTSRWVRGAVGGDGGDRFELQCPRWQSITTINGRATNLVNNVSLTCAYPVP